MRKANVTEWVVILSACAVSVLAEETAFTETTAAACLKLTPPVSVLSYTVYRDGGSIGMSLADARGEELHVFEDWSLGSGGELAAGKTGIPLSVREQHKGRPDTRGRIFIGQGSPTADRAITPVDDGKRIKAAAECLAVAWVDREFTPEGQAQLMSLMQKRRDKDPQYRELEEKILPPKKKADTEEGDKALGDDYLKRRNRVEAATRIVAKLKGMEPPRKKPELPEP